ncbi:MAG: sugar phosphate isomerase/epimerase [Rhodospirillaceae bacterium]|nr:sugar phosphate isomerase/epimerase [Rhodospirillaceae bacterium]
MQCDFRESIECFARHGVHQTAIWRDKLNEIGLDEAVRILQDNDMTVNALCPGGLLTEIDDKSFNAALDLNRRWIDQSAALGADSLVIITGGLADGETNLAAARDRALEGFFRLIDPARAVGIRLAVEPLHPMVCGGRSVISTVANALDLLDDLGADDVFGLAVDSYAVWWDLALSDQLARAGARLLHFHASDWLRDTKDVRFDRGMPGDGMIDNRQIRGWMEKAGFSGPVEVEIFSRDHWWQHPADEVVRTIVDRRATHL